MDSISPTQDIQPQLPCDLNVSYRNQGAEDGEKLAEQHTNLATARESVLRDINMSPEVILDLKTRLNTLIAIERLPNELWPKS